MIALMLSGLLAILPSTQLHNSIKQVHSTTVEIDIDAHFRCSGTKIGPHAILTVDHCFPSGATSTTKLDIDKQPVTVKGSIHDKADHLIVIVSSTFTQWSRFGQLPELGDTVFTFGNPAVFTDILRVGRIAGFSYGSTLYDINDYHGDSGASIFNAEGKIIGVVSDGVGTLEDSTGPRSTIGFKLIMSKPMSFTAPQLLEASH